MSTCFYPDITIIKCGSPYRGHKELLKSLIQAHFPEQVVVISTYDSAQGDSTWQSGDRQNRNNLP